jgi:hypothetical protein
MLPGVSGVNQMSLISTFKGWVGETSTQFGMWVKLDEKVYKRFHDLILQTETGSTQIDHVLLSRFGIFVIETKNYEGWIYGGQKQRNWTQNLFGKKFQFQNPLHQNYKHTKALSECLELDHAKIHSIIFFAGDADLKGQFPPNVMSQGLSAYIKGFQSVIFSDVELDRLYYRLEQIKDGQTLWSTRQHVQNLKERYTSTSQCPKCAGALVERTIKNGPKAGETFLGCSAFPKCRYSQSQAGMRGDIKS